MRFGSSAGRVNKLNPNSLFLKRYTGYILDVLTVGEVSTEIFTVWCSLPTAPSVILDNVPRPVNTKQ